MRTTNEELDDLIRGAKIDLEEKRDQIIMDAKRVSMLLAELRLYRRNAARQARSTGIGSFEAARRLSSAVLDSKDGIIDQEMREDAYGCRSGIAALDEEHYSEMTGGYWDPIAPDNLQALIELVRGNTAPDKSKH